MEGLIMEEIALHAFDYDYDYYNSINEKVNTIDTNMTNTENAIFSIVKSAVKSRQINSKVKSFRCQSLDPKVISILTEINLLVR